MHPFDGRVVSNFIVQALQGKDITVFGDGSQSRSFCFVDDLIDGFLLMLDADKATGPINLGNPNEFTILELAKKTVELVGSNSQVVMKPLPEDDPIQRQPDITLAKATLGWEPSIQLDEGLARTIAWFSGIDIDAWDPPTPNWSGGLTAATAKNRS
jgi:UDP-glucuronate decarboxylase